MRLIITILFLFVPLTIFCQHYPDREMAGFKTPVRWVTATTYNSLVLADSVWIPKDMDEFSSQTTTFYNAKGFIDSMLTVMKNKETTTVRRVIYQNKGNIKTVALVYWNDILTERFTHEWQDKYTFLQKNVDSSNKLVSRIKVTLSADFTEQKSEHEYYDAMGKITIHSKAEIARDKNNWLSEITEYNVLDKTGTVHSYYHRKYDSRNTPTESVIITSGREQPSRVIYRTVEYY